MPKSHSKSSYPSRLHVAIVMDGSGRWARQRGWPRSAGHRAGTPAVQRVVRAAPQLGIGTLTLHAFSSDNWQRPREEVSELLRIFRDYLSGEIPKWIEAGVRVKVLGRRDRIPDALRAAMEAAEAATSAGRALTLRLIIDYSARDAILGAAGRWPGPGTPSRRVFADLLANVVHDDAGPPELDLLIRTGGEQRLSDFLLWECAYAELVFTPRLWPDFDATDLRAALEEFHSRERRFGRVPLSLAG